MQKLKPRLLTLAIAVALPSFAIADIMPPEETQQPPEQKAVKTSSIFQESSQALSNGFLEDSSLNVKFRNLYMNRDFRNSSNSRRSPNGERQSYRESWSQGIIGVFESGFTEGTIGFGVDAIGMYGFRLDGGRGRSGNGDVPRDPVSGRPDRDFSKGGGAVKVRISNTTLKYGEQFVDTPVFSTDDSRILPETTEGFLLTSNEIENLTIKVGHFTALKAQDQSYRDSINGGGPYGFGHKAGRGLKRADIAGATYQFTPDLSVSLYYSDVKDFWKKKYANVNYNIPINDDQALTFDFNIYNTKSQGYIKRETERKTDNKLNSNIWSLQASYAIGAHKFSVSHQRVTGNGGFPYGIEGGGAIYLPNSVQYSDFNHDGERSWQVRYDLNMAQYGVPGLTLMTRYTRGTNAREYQRSVNPGGQISAWQHDMEAKYVIQEGPIKDLSIRVRHGNYRSSGFADDVRDLRVIVEYPWDVLGTFRK